MWAVPCHRLGSQSGEKRRKLGDSTHLSGVLSGNSVCSAVSCLTHHEGLYPSNNNPKYLFLPWLGFYLVTATRKVQTWGSLPRSPNMIYSTNFCFNQNTLIGETGPGAGEMPLCLRVHTGFRRTQEQSPEPTFSSWQVPISPVAGDLMPSGFLRHLHTHGAHKLTQHSHIQMDKNK